MAIFPDVNKKIQITKILIFVILLAYLTSLITYRIQLPVADDIARHIINGSEILDGHFDVLYQNVYSYTEPDHSFVNHHWLSGVIFFLLFKTIGWDGLVIFKVIIFLITFTLLFFSAKRKSNFWLAAVFSIPSILILAGRADVRPEIFSYLFIAICIYFLFHLEDNEQSNKIFWLIPLQLLWVNLHIFFPIGIMLVGGFLLEKIILNWKNIKENILIKKLTIIFFAIILVCLINPNGFVGATEPFRIFSNYGIDVNENYSMAEFLKTEIFWSYPSMIAFVGSALLLALSYIANFVFALKNKHIFLFIASLATITIGFLMVRNITFFSFIFLPAIATNINNLGFIIKYKWKYKEVFLWFCIISFTTIWLTKVDLGELRTGLFPRSEEAVNFIKQNNIIGPIFNDYDSGSYLIYGLFPQEKVFVDNRPEAYSEDFFINTYLPMMQDEAVWRTVSQKYDFNTIFIYQYNMGPYIRPFIFRRLSDPEWVLVYAGTYDFVFIKNIPDNQNIIEKFKITPENADMKLDHLVVSNRFDDQIAAADIFNLLGREDLGKNVFLNVLKQWPDKKEVWMVMGEWEVNGSRKDRDLYAGIEYLEKAIDLGQKTAEAYYYLALGYFRTMQDAKAKDALDLALKINPDYQAAKDLLEEMNI